ncbi:hypothetical protein QE152_g4838 [Popillia japonica]|uniref:Uncharacterized protein n=1 Tax=Popillia japonica TaxID=7064 RepID=A0AAW1MZH6_POPJA
MVTLPLTLLMNGIVRSVSNHENIEVLPCGSPFASEDVHHRAIEASINVKHIKYAPNTPFTCDDYRKANYIRINNVLSNINWAVDFSNADVNKCVDVLYEKLFCVINNFVDCWYFHNTVWAVQDKHKIHKKILRSGYFHNTVWAVQDKHKIHKKILRSGDRDDSNYFSEMRKRVKKLIREDYARYILATEHNLSQNNLGRKNFRSFWSYVSNKRASPNSFSMHMSNGTSTSNSLQETCDLFMQHFSSVYEPGDDPCLINNKTSFNCFAVSEMVVQARIDRLDINKGAGPGGLPPYFVKACSHSLSVLLAIIYNKSLTECVFPLL